MSQDVDPLSEDTQRTMIAALEREGFQITKAPPRENAAAKIEYDARPGGAVRIGVVSDTHLGSRAQ